MTGRNRVIQTLLSETPDRLPRSFAADVAVQNENWELIDSLSQRYPSDILIIDGRNGTGYSNQVPESLDLSPENFAHTVELLCDITSQFTLGIVGLSPWTILQGLLAPDSTDDYDDLLVRFEESLKPWLESPLDGLCLFDPISTEQRWDKEAMLNFTDLMPFYKIFVKRAREADKYVFFDFGGKVLEAVPTLIKLRADAVACVLDTDTAVSLSDFTISFKPFSEAPDGPRLTFWASLPRQTEDAADWFETKAAAQSVLTELNQFNKGVIANGFWHENQKWNSPALALQAWEQGIPLPKPEKAEESEQPTLGSPQPEQNGQPQTANS